MTSYITWNKNDDAAFRDYYFNLTGEMIQADPMDAGANWQVGSSRLTADSISELLKFAGVMVSEEI